MAMKKLGTKKTFNKTNLDGVPNQSGVYVVNNTKGETLYIGKAGGGRLQERLKEHLSEKDIRGSKTFQFRTTTSDREAQKLEKQYINKLNPKQNIQNNSK